MLNGWWGLLTYPVTQDDDWQQPTTSSPSSYKQSSLAKRGMAQRYGDNTAALWGHPQHASNQV